MFAKQGGAYTISRSVRLRSSASAYFNRTSGSPTNASIFTHSFWVKRGSISANQTLICGARPTNFDRIYFTSTDTLLYQWNDGTSNLAYLETTQVFRDPSAWYHIVVTTDTTQATSSNRVKIYINGSQVTAFSSTTYPTQNSTSYFNTNAVTLNIGRSTSATFYLDCYLTETNFIDGQALTPTSFGAFDAVTGVWNPKKYSGTYGTNGFYLNFSDNSNNTAATIGKDYSGNGNNWTPNNISVTAGTTYDSMVDVPIGYGSDTGAGGEVRGNYCVLNPVDTGSSVTLSNANLQYTKSGTAWTGSGSRGTFGVSSGKWYWEATVATAVTNMMIGVNLNSTSLSNAYSNPTDSWTYYTAGTKFGNGSGNVSYGASYTTNDVIGVALNMDSGTLTFYKNGTSQGTAFSTGISGNTMFPLVACAEAGSWIANFGQRAFAYTAPSGYKALCTQNLSTPTILNGANYMAASLYTGTGASQAVSNAVNSISFQPDFVWIKSRSAATDHKLTDAVRGATKALISDTTGAETTDTNGLTAFGSSGFTVGTDTVYNNSGATYVGWQWKANGAGSSNTAGSITSTVSANTTAGFSIVSYTGTGTAGTIGHGLGATPAMIIVKYRSNAEDWFVWHKSLNGGSVGNYSLYLDGTRGEAALGTPWNGTAPTSTVFSVGAGGQGTNNSGYTIIAYCFAPISGYSAFGSYTGNGSSDGPFVYCGFRPRFVLIKRSDSGAENWRIVDTTRGPYNVFGIEELYPNSSAAEGGVGTANFIDALSNGFKLRNTGSGVNASGGTYIYAAFAENPFTISRAR